MKGLPRFVPPFPLGLQPSFQNPAVGYLPLVRIGISTTGDLAGPASRPGTCLLLIRFVYPPGGAR